MGMDIAAGNAKWKDETRAGQAEIAADNAVSRARKGMGPE